MSTIQNKIIAVLVLLACILLFNTTYAKYSTASSDTTLANTNKQLDIKFTNPKIVKSIGANEKDSSIKLSSDNKSIYLNVSDLAFPGARVEFSVDIVNQGMFSAKIDSINAEGFKENNAIKIEGLDSLTNSPKILHSGEKCTISFSIYWDKNYNTVLEDKTNFKIKLNYSQSI